MQESKKQDGDSKPAGDDVPADEKPAGSGDPEDGQSDHESEVTINKPKEAWLWEFFFTPGSFQDGEGISDEELQQLLKEMEEPLEAVIEKMKLADADDEVKAEA